MDGFQRALGYDSHAPTGGEDGAMLLQCESEGRGDGPTTGWLRAGTLESLVELNELCLALIAEQAAAHGATGSALLRQVGELWRELDAPARRRAAACPYLLLDAGFADTARWRRGGRAAGGRYRRRLRRLLHRAGGRRGSRGWCSPTPGTSPARRRRPRGCCSACRAPSAR